MAISLKLFGDCELAFRREKWLTLRGSVHVPKMSRALRGRRLPTSGERVWRQQAKTFWRCDFFAKSASTLKGFRDLYVLVFMQVQSRRVWKSHSAFHPDETMCK